MSGFPPYFLCSSKVSLPPENALLNLDSTSFGESVVYIAERSSEDDILPEPLSPGKNLLIKSPGFFRFNLPAISLVILTNGS